MLNQVQHDVYVGYLHVIPITNTSLRATALFRAAPLQFFRIRFSDFVDYKRV